MIKLLTTTDKRKILKAARVRVCDGGLVHYVH